MMASKMTKKGDGVCWCCKWSRASVHIGREVGVGAISVPVPIQAGLVVATNSHYLPPSVTRSYTNDTVAVGLPLPVATGPIAH